MAADEHERAGIEKSLGVVEGGGLAAYLGNCFEGGRAGELGLGSREAQPARKIPRAVARPCRTRGPPGYTSNRFSRQHGSQTALEEGSRPNGRDWTGHAAPLLDGGEIVPLRRLLLGGKRSFAGDCSPKIRITLGRSKIRTAGLCQW